MNKVCYNCKYENLKVTEEPCKFCTGDGGSHNKWEEKHCIDCTFFLKGYDEEPCEFCCGNVNKPNFKLQGHEETEVNTSEHEVTFCVNCKYRHTKRNEEPCKSCTMHHSNWEESLCGDCKYLAIGVDVEPCKFCINREKELNIINLKPNFELKETESEQEVKNCLDCKHFSKNIYEEPCCGCLCVDKGEHSYWEAPAATTTTDTEETEEIFCEDCKYADLGSDEEPCNRCKQNSGNIAEDHDKLTLCYEPKETESEQESEDTKAHCDTCKHVDKSLSESPCSNCCDVGMGDDCYYEPKEAVIKNIKDILPSCHTCKYATEPTHNRPCANCIALGNGIQSYWEARNDEPQTAREIVEKAVEQHLQEEHYDEHYHDKVQPLEIMQEIMTPEEFKGFLFGNIIKYTCRCGRKDEPQKEFSKLRRYREWYDMAVMGRHIDPRI